MDFIRKADLFLPLTTIPVPRDLHSETFWIEMLPVMEHFGRSFPQNGWTMAAGHFAVVVIASCFDKKQRLIFEYIDSDFPTKLSLRIPVEEINEVEAAKGASVTRGPHPV
jgi:hypothetical protein